MPLGGARAGLFGGNVGIPDSVVNQWELANNYTDSVGTDDGTPVGNPQFVSRADAIGGFELDLDGTDDGVDTPATSPSGSITLLITVDISTDITTNQRLHNFDDGSSGQRFLRFGDSGTQRELEAFVANDSGTLQSTSYQLPTQGRFRVGLVLDTSVPELRIGVDGSFVSTTSLTGTFTDNSMTHSLGYNRNSGAEYFGGSLDEAIVANEAYNSFQLTQDYDRQPWS